MDKRVIFILVFILFLVFILLSNIGADIISINPGGDEELVITSDKYIEGFFSCVPYTCSQLGYSCGSWSDGCGRTLDCGTCASGYTCTSGTCVAEAAPPEVPGAPGAPEVIPPTYLEIFPKEFNIRMAINTNQPEVIKIKNIGTSSRKVYISQRNLDNLVILGNTSLELAPQETKYLNVIFVAPSEPGIYTGKILIDREEVLVTLNVKTKLLLFDSNIVVLNKDYKVARGEDLRTKVSLIPLGDEERMDVTLNYVIKDYEGKIYLRQTETILIEKKVDFKKNFATGNLPLGEYIVGLELVYPSGVAPSSANFKVVETLPGEFFGKLVLFLIISILVIAVIIIALLIRKKIGER